jgi:hypothetical protein
MIVNNDLRIAAHAVAPGLTLVKVPPSRTMSMSFRAFSSARDISPVELPEGIAQGRINGIAVAEFLPVEIEFCRTYEASSRGAHAYAGLSRGDET